MTRDTRHPHVAPVISLAEVRRNSGPHPVAGRGLLYCTATAVCCLSALLCAGLAVAGVLATRGQSGHALHAAARSLPLVAAAFAHVVVHAPASLCSLTLILGFVHLLDFAVGIVGRDAVEVGGPLLGAVFTLACAIPQVFEQLRSR